MASKKLFQLIPILSLLSPLSLLSAAAQLCSTNDLTGSAALYRSCSDLSNLNSFLYWSYDPESGNLVVAFRHVGMAKEPSKWIAWGINPNGLATAMVGAQALVAFWHSDSKIKAYTSQVAGYDVETLPEGDLIYPVSDLGGRFENGEMVLSATLQLSKNMSMINQVWQEGPVLGDQPAQHAMDPSNFQCKGTLDLLSGQLEKGGGSSKLRNCNVHEILNVVSWAILMPVAVGVIIARYV